MNSSSVAVITRTKNRGLLLERAVKSVLAQSHCDWHHVIVNDGGDPAPVDALLAKYNDAYSGRLTIIHHAESKGMEAASNAGINASTSKYVVIHDDDDSWQPEFLHRCITALQQSEFPSVRGVVSRINQVFERIEDGQVIEERRNAFNPDLAAISLPQISEINRFLPISFLFERAVFDEIGLYDESLPVIGDWEFNIRFFSRFDALVVKEELANYHVRTDKQGNYANSVTAESDDHKFYRALIVNKHIRADMESGRASIGSLLSQGDYFHRTSGNLERIGNVLDKLKDLPVIKQIRKIVKK